MVLPRLRPGTGAILLAAALLALQVIAGGGGLRAQDDVYTVRQVEVDVTADSAAAARDQAILEGQRKAFDQLLQNLVSPADVARLPSIDNDAIANMVLDFEVDSENVSTVRYIGELTFRFRAEPVRRYLEQSGVGYAVTATRPALVVPVLTRDGASLLWDEGNDWLAAWSSGAFGGTLVQITVPLGDLSDIAAIDAQRALAGDLTALQALAQRYGAGDVVVAEAKLSTDAAANAMKLDLDARRYTTSGAAGSLQETLSVPAGDDAMAELYAAAADRVSAFLQEEWKRENLVSSTAEQHLDVAVSFSGQEDWIDLRRRLGEVSTLRRAVVQEMSRSRARLDLVFVGDQAQLTRALAQRDLSLVPLPPQPGAGASPGAAPAGAAGAMPGPLPGPAAVPGTGGAVTVDPGALPGAAPAVPAVSSAPRWELRRGTPMPDRTSSLPPATDAAAPAPPGQPTPPAE